MMPSTPALLLGFQRYGPEVQRVVIFIRESRPSEWRVTKVSHLLIASTEAARNVAAGLEDVNQ